VRRLVFNVHLYLALLAGVFIACLGLTGSIMAFEPEIDHLLHWRLSYITAQGNPKPLSELGEAVVKAFPGERISGYVLPSGPGFSYGVATQRGLVAVNPYTAEILGVRPRGMDFLGYVHQFHLRLLIRNKADTGRRIVSWSGVALLLLLISGLYLWWPLKRVNIHAGATGRRFWFDIHNTVGIVSLVFLLVLTVTGLMIGFEEKTIPMFYRLTGSEPSRQPQNFAAPPPGARPISPDRAMEIARTALPGTQPFQIEIPGPKGAYQIHARYPEDLTPAGRSRVVVGQYTGQVLFAEGSRTAPAGARMVIGNRAIHTGDIFGIPSKTIMCLACLMVVAQVVSGLLMWLKRVRRPVKS